MKPTANTGRRPRYPDYLSVKEVAQLLKISPSTVRAWDKKGLLKALRHPSTNYRLYKAGVVARLAEKLGNNKTSHKLLA